MNIFVSNLNFRIDANALKELFVVYGEVSSSKIIMDQLSGKSRGFGFVKMPDEEAGNKAIEALNGKWMDGKRLVVNRAFSKSKSARRFY